MMTALPSLRNQVEPQTLPQCFMAMPPAGFQPLEALPMPAFVAPFDLLTTTQDTFKAHLRRLPGYRYWSRLLTVDTAFIGSTVSEYALLPRDVSAQGLARRIRAEPGGQYALTIIKDLPNASPLLTTQDNAFADALILACEAEGFVTVQGQALAYVPIDFKSADTYLQRLPRKDRGYLRRRLRRRDEIEVRRVPTGPAFANDTRVDQYYVLYEQVYAQSEIHFDRLTREFFATLLRSETTMGIVFEYWERASGELLGWNLCFEENGKLVDKYIGLAYPKARELSLYFVSWIVNLEYALERNLTCYIAGWTDPAVKALLGSCFTPTRHAVYVRNPLLRKLARRFSDHFAQDSQWLPARERQP